MSAQPGSETYWRYRLLHAEILLELRKIKEAAEVLSETAPVQWPDIHGRSLLMQAHVQYRLARNDEAERLLMRATGLLHSAACGASIPMRGHAWWTSWSSSAR